MIESRCGILCSQCTKRAAKQCPGCSAMTKPFWGRCCALKSCCEEKGLGHCGQCQQFPCELLMSYAYHPETGDGGKRICRCKADCKGGC